MARTGRIREALGLLARVLASLAALALVTHLLYRPFVIPSESMEPTLRPGDRVLARIVGVQPSSLARGEVVAFSHGETWEEDRLDDRGSLPHTLVRTVGDVLGVGPSHHQYTVKRIVGLPGETVRCCDAHGRLLVDDRPVPQPWVTQDQPFVAGRLECTSTPRAPRCFPEVTVPAGSYLVLGDNRANSADSVVRCRVPGADGATCARVVPADRIVGTVDVRWWPWPPGDALRSP